MALTHGSQVQILPGQFIKQKEIYMRSIYTKDKEELKRRMKSFKNMLAIQRMQPDKVKFSKKKKEAIEKEKDWHIVDPHAATGKEGHKIKGQSIRDYII